MIKVQKLNKTYDWGRPNANKVLHNISFELPDTGFVCILGASGCGKTSLLNAIGGLDSFQGGKLTADDVTVSRYGTAVYEAERNRSFGYIFQNYYLLMDHSVGYNVYMGLHSLKLSHSEKLKRVRAALEAVEMDRYIRRTVGELSGGQQQRVAIARALARQPRVIFADEPTGNLDEANTLKICSLLRSISRNSLVVMVTHEERLANFFADRIITLDAGRIQEDKTAWQRQDISAEAGKTVYAGDYAEITMEAEGIRLRVLRSEDAEPVNLTLVAERGRIILKIDDQRSVSVGKTQTIPALKEGKRPVLSLEVLDRERDMLDSLGQRAKNDQGRSGQGIGVAMLVQEARRLVSGTGGLRNIGMKLFLVLLTVLTMIIAGDYIAVASLDPEDFITSDPHMLEISVDYGSELTEEDDTLTALSGEYLEYLRESDVGYHLVPSIAVAEYYTDVYMQMGEQKLQLTGFSYVPLQYMDESTLIHGRMPENSREIVVDRWVLEAVLKGEGILENSIPDITYFLGKNLTYFRKNCSPVIVGICDGGSPAVYMPLTGLVCLGSGNKDVIGISEFQAMFPGEYDDLVLERGQCVVNATQAGIHYLNGRLGSEYRMTSRTNYVITQVIESDVYAPVIVSDEALEDMLWDVTGTKFFLYCEDKAEVQSFLREKSPLEADGYLVKTVRDRYNQTMNAYMAASTMKVDGRTIVTMTVMALAAVMLYLLCRSQTQQRIGMLAVYRLLGIPNRKLLTIFTLESILTSLTTALPAAGLTWAAVELSKLVPEWNVSLLLPWQAALGVYGIILAYHIFVSLLPLNRLLRLPPAQLAAKYDM